MLSNIRPWLRALIFSCLLTALSSAPLYAANVGEPVEEITAQLIDGTQFKLSEHRGEVVMLNFWAAWCEPCRLEMPLLQRYAAEHRKDRFYLLTINMDDPADEAIALKVAQQFSLPVALRKNSQYKTLGRIWRLPSTFVIDRDGHLIKDGSKGVPVITQEDLDHLVTPRLQPL